MKRTKKELCILLLSLLLITSTIIGIIILPDTIPIHFNAQGKATSFSTKFCNLIDVIVYWLILLGIYLYSKSLKKKIYTSNDEKYIADAKKNLLISHYISILFLLNFNIMNIYTIYVQYTYNINSSSSNHYDFYKVIMICLGIILILIGNILPTLKLNSSFGIRTSWSKKNDLSWYYSQRWGGFTFIVCGILMLISSIFFNNLSAIIVMILIIILSTITSVILSYFSYKKSLK